MLKSAMSSAAVLVLATPGIAAPEPAGGIAMPPARHTATLAAPRGQGMFNGAVVSMRDELENYPPGVSIAGSVGVFAEPFSVLGPDGFEWGLNNLRGQQLPFAQIVDLSGAPIGDGHGVVNGSQVVRINTANGQTPGGFFLGARLEFPYELRPGGVEPVDVSGELFLERISELYSFESAAGRLLWGGTCVETFPGDCEAIGLPVGPILTMYSLKPKDGGLGGTGRFFEVRYCTTDTGQVVPGCVPHPGFAVGDPVSPPIHQWFRLRMAINPDLTLDFRMDRLDGAGETLISRQFGSFTLTMQSVGVNSAFEAGGATLYFDNITATGALLLDPQPPFECPYLDTLNWLVEGPLADNGQDRWEIFPPAAPEVLPRTASEPEDFAIREESVLGDDLYRAMFGTDLPTHAPAMGEETVFSADLRTTGPGTTRGVSLYAGTILAARVFLGYHDPSTGVFNRTILVQSHSAFDPLTMPVQPGFGVADTGVEFLNSAGLFQKLILRTSRAGRLTVLLDQGAGPVPIYVGPCFTAGVFNRVRFESSNAFTGLGARLYVDNIEAQCSQPLFCSADGDTNRDGRVDFADLNAVLTNFGFSFTGIAGDTNGDNTVDFADLNAVLTNFGEDCLNP